MNQEADLHKPYDQKTIKPFQTTLLAKRVEVMARLQRNGDPIFIEELKGFELVAKPEALAKHETEERKDKKELVDVEEALKKIEDGSYGLCDVCQKRIFLARLEVYPTAESCVLCYYVKKH